MASEYRDPISIKEAIDAITKQDYLLPAIQRKFVWKNNQICNLFDSIMRGYPINTFLMWEITTNDIKNNYKFYEFLKEYCERFKEENPPAITYSSLDFKAIIDGQQRLTSLYIGLCGTYAYKRDRKWWPKYQDNKILPPRKLYLDLKNPLKSDYDDSIDDDSLFEYKFSFLTKEQYQSSLKDEKHYWFCLHDILTFESVDRVNIFLKHHGWSENKFAHKALSKLYEVIMVQKIIHYFNETSQKIDHVLDVFIRTNSGGTKLSLSDMLMSIVVANWKEGDFRQEIDSLKNSIRGEMEFNIGQDWILKTCLMLTNSDVKFKVKNFNVEQVEKIQKEWDDIKKCIEETLKLIRTLGINSQSLTSKNAVIPICYYLYKHKQDENTQPLYHDINNPNRFDDQRTEISKWLYMTLFKHLFGGQADTILTSIRTVLKENIQEPLFPLENIIEKYKGTNNDLSFNNEYIEGLLDIQYPDSRCRALLHLLFPEMNPNVVFDIDHLHPKKDFKEKELQKNDFLKANPDLMDFYKDNKHWNSIANLHLLNILQNRGKRGKHAKPLIDWIKDPDVNLDYDRLLVEKESDLEFKNFKQFYEKRRAKLKEKLEKRVAMSSSSSSS